MMFRTIILVGLFPVLLVACSTTPVPTNEALQVPADRILEAGRRLAVASPTTGKIIVKRDSGIMGSACSTRIYVDGVPVADIDPAEKAEFNLAEGDHILSAEPKGMCGGTITEVKTSVKPHTEQSFRYGTSGNGSPSIYPTAF